VITATPTNESQFPTTESLGILPSSPMGTETPPRQLGVPGSEHSPSGSEIEAPSGEEEEEEEEEESITEGGERTERKKSNRKPRLVTREQSIDFPS